MCFRRLTAGLTASVGVGLVVYKSELYGWISVWYSQLCYLCYSISSTEYKGYEVTSQKRRTMYVLRVCMYICMSASRDPQSDLRSILREMLLIFRTIQYMIMMQYSSGTLSLTLHRRRSCKA